MGLIQCVSLMEDRMILSGLERIFSAGLERTFLSGLHRLSELPGDKI